MDFESNEEILANTMDCIRNLHEENAKLKQHNDQLCDINLKLSQERDDLNVEKNELNQIGRAHV